MTTLELLEQQKHGTATARRASMAEQARRYVAARYTCPVCAYDGLRAPPDWSYEICPQCGVEFGVDDFGTPHAGLRLRWIAAGCPSWTTAATDPAWAQWYEAILSGECC